MSKSTFKMTRKSGLKATHWEMYGIVGGWLYSVLKNFQFWNKTIKTLLVLIQMIHIKFIKYCRVNNNTAVSKTSKITSRWALIIELGLIQFGKNSLNTDGYCLGPFFNAFGISGTRNEAVHSSFIWGGSNELQYMVMRQRN